MAGQTNHAARLLAKETGACGLVTTELLSSLAIHYKSNKTFAMFDWTDDERPVAVQLFGADPDVMAEAAQVVADSGADIVDINMGCWVPKVAKQGAGAALLRDVLYRRNRRACGRQRREYSRYRQSARGLGCR